MRLSRKPRSATSRKHRHALGLRLGFALGLIVAGLAGAASEESPPLVVHIALDSIIHPVAAQFLEESLAEAEAEDADLFVLELSTPGGLLTSTREMSTAMLGSDLPIVVYVAPSGAQAASAGFFLLMAGDVAAMAPGTNTGAAHPVGGQGEDIEGAMGEKVEQDAAATIRSLAARSGRDQQLAEQAVVESRSFTAEEALEAGLIDLIAADMPTLLEEIDGRELNVEGKETMTLRTANADVRTLEMNSFQRLLATIAHPNIAYILMSLGFLGLYFELSNPGAVLPGVIGGICLILAFFALSVLPVNYAGIALLLLAAVFFVAEVKVTSYGLLTLAGIVSLVLGSLMLFKSADPAIKVSLEVIVAISTFAAVVVLTLMTIVLKVHRTQVKTGVEGLLHKTGIVRTAMTPRGKVFVHGELWDGLADSELPVGTSVEVVGVDGMTLKVRPSGDELPLAGSSG